MEKFTQKYAIIQLFEDRQEGYLFSSDDWPLHSTIVDTFAIDWDVPAMTKNLTKMLGNHGLIDSVAINEEYLGTEKQTKVVLLKKSKSLVKLHHDVVKMLQLGNLKLNDPQFAYKGFLPHSTIQNNRRLNKGDKVVFDALSIVDMFPDNDPNQRKILKTIKISSNG